MQFLRSMLLFAASSIALVSAAASTSPETKLERAQALTLKSKYGLIDMNNEIYADLITKPRDYSVMVLLTAMDSRYQCQMCKIFDPEYKLLAKSWNRKNPDGGDLFFGVLDFNNGKETFMKLGVSTAPMLYLFPPTTGPDAKPRHADDPLKYEFSQTDVPAETVAHWISRSINRDVRVTRPVDYGKISMMAGAVIISLVILKLAFSTLKPALYSKNLWAAISLILILLFTSGHMFNQIRNVPYMMNDAHGRISYIAGGFSNQFGVETQIIAMIYALLSFAVISLGFKMPMVKDSRKQKLAIIVWNCVLLAAFSFLMNIFKQKNGGYPFKLPPFM